MTLSYDVSLALRAGGLAAAFNRAGVLTAADVHVAHRLGRIGGETDEAVLLAAALLVRATRHGSVVLDLAAAERTTTPEVDVDCEVPVAHRALDWPGPDWVARVAASPLVGEGAPLRMVGSRVWLARYWEQEEQVACELRERCSAAPDDLDLAVLAEGLSRLFPAARDADQRAAAQACALHRVSVLAGGPGTGKTTTVSRLLALLREQHREWRIALAAPTGKAAARLEEAVRSSPLPAADRERLGELSATTLHRLLGWRPEARSRFRHDRGNRLPAEVVVVDEASMVSLTLMARLLEALRPAARLVLVGDPDQLASVEAGAVLGDLVAGAGRPTASAVAVAPLRHNRRFHETSGIARLAAAVQAGRGQEALAVLRAADAPEVELVEADDDAVLSPAQLDGLRADVVASGVTLLDAAARGDVGAALAALDSHRLLCAHRRGPRGEQHWRALAARWVAAARPVPTRPDGRYAGEALLVTANDHDAGLYNGDTGVVVDDGHGGLVAAFGRGGAPILVPLARLGAVRPLHAMTVHRSQGSQFSRVTLLLPPAGSPLGTRETLYTAVTRATAYVRVVGSATAVVEAVGRPAARATGLRERLGGRIGDDDPA